METITAREAPHVQHQLIEVNRKLDYLKSQVAKWYRRDSSTPNSIHWMVRMR